jgi:histidine ammonia-lyase
LGCEAVIRAENIMKTADIIAAMTIEAMQGSFKQFDARIHKQRPHKGQNIVSSRMRTLLLKNGRSKISLEHKFCKRVQDSYSLRCIPQVHGIVYDTIEWVKGILSVEINSATDNPMYFYH